MEIGFGAEKSQLIVMRALQNHKENGRICPASNRIASRAWMEMGIIEKIGTTGKGVNY